MLASETGGCLVEVARHPLTLEPFTPPGTKQDNTDTVSFSEEEYTLSSLSALNYAKKSFLL